MVTRKALRLLALVSALSFAVCLSPFFSALAQQVQVQATHVGGDGGVQSVNIVGISMNSDGGGGIPTDPVKIDQPGTTCCGQSAGSWQGTAIAYPPGATVYGCNLGPNAVTLAADGGQGVGGGILLQGASTPTLTPGGCYSFTATGVPYTCTTNGAAQTLVDAGYGMVGCLTTNVTLQ
jgi:hypothetical protein